MEATKADMAKVGAGEGEEDMVAEAATEAEAVEVSVEEEAEGATAGGDGPLAEGWKHSAASGQFECFLLFSYTCIHRRVSEERNISSYRHVGRLASLCNASGVSTPSNRGTLHPTSSHT